MDSDDEVIPAGRGAGDEPELELDDLLEQPASEAQEPRLSRLKRKVDAGDDAPVKTKKRTAVLDSPLDTDLPKTTETTETPSPGGDEKSTRRGDSDGGEADAAEDGEEVEAQGAQSGEEAGSDAEASQNSGSDGEGGDGEEEVNEEEALEKFIDEGGKLSDLDSGSEGEAPEMGAEALLAVLPKKRNKDKTSKKEKERQMAEEQKRFERSNARFEGAEFEKKDLGGILAKFKARFEELPAPPPKDVVRRRGSTGRPQPIAVSLEELEDMIADEGVVDDGDGEMIVIQEGSDKDGSGSESGSEESDKEEAGGEEGHLSLRLASTQEDEMLASPSQAAAEEARTQRSSRAHRPPVALEFRRETQASSPCRLTRPPPATQEEGFGNEEEEEEEDGEGGSGSDEDGDDEAEEGDDEDGSGSESGSEGAADADGAEEGAAAAAELPQEEEEEEMSPEERAALAQRKKQALIEQLIRESKRKERRPAAGQDGFLEEEAEMSEDGGHTDDEDDAEEEAKIRKELEELLDGDDAPDGDEDREARAQAHALWEAAQDRKEMNHLVQAIKNGFKRTGNRGVMGDDDDDGEMQRRRRRNGNGEEEEDEDADEAIVRNPFMAALEADEEDDVDDGLGTQRLRAKKALETAEAVALTEALQEATDKDLLLALAKRKAEAPQPPPAAAAGADRHKKPEQIRPPGLAGFLGRAASVRESSQNILKKAGDMSLGGGGRSFVFGRDESNSAFPEDRGASRAGATDSRAGGPAPPPPRGASGLGGGAPGGAAAPARARVAVGGSQGSQGSSLFGLLRAKSSQEGGAAGAGNSATFASEDCKALAAGLRKVTTAPLKPGPGVLAAYNRSEAAKAAAKRAAAGRTGE